MIDDTDEVLFEPIFTVDTTFAQAILFNDDIIIFASASRFPIIFDPREKTLRYSSKALQLSRGRKSLIISTVTHLFAFGGDHYYGTDTSYEIGTIVYGEGHCTWNGEGRVQVGDRLCTGVESQAICLSKTRGKVGCVWILGNGTVTSMETIENNILKSEILSLIHI